MIYSLAKLCEVRKNHTQVIIKLRNIQTPISPLDSETLARSVNTIYTKPSTSRFHLCRLIILGKCAKLVKRGTDVKKLLLIKKTVIIACCQ